MAGDPRLFACSQQRRAARAVDRGLPEGDDAVDEPGVEARKPNATGGCCGPGCGLNDGEDGPAPVGCHHAAHIEAGIGVVDVDAPGLEHLHVDMTRALKAHGVEPSDAGAQLEHIRHAYGANPASPQDYALREVTLAAKKARPKGSTTAVSCCGANPGMVSWMVKQALVDIAGELKLDFTEPHGRGGPGKNS